MHNVFRTKALVKGLLVGSLLAAQAAFATSVSTPATFIITSRDAAGVGFNDTTPVAPVGGNDGTTLGEQRWNVYRFVADIWSKNIQSPVPITISAAWEALDCTATGAVLGSASAFNGWSDFPNAPKPGTWYPQALANKLANVGMSLWDYYETPPDPDFPGFGHVDIKTQFNVNLGKAGCLTGTPFYLGLDGKAPTGQINLMTTLLHELGHGLGFTVFTTSTSNGSQLFGMPSVWEGFMVDNTSGKRWTQMTNAERVTSAINFRQLAWTGPNAVAAVPLVLTTGSTPVPSLRISGPAAGSTAGTKQFGAAQFGPALGAPISADIMPVVTPTSGGPACGPLTTLDALAVKGRIALIDRGACTFTVKVKNAQNAGAKGVLIANTATSTFSGMSGADDTITIPSLMVTFSDGNALKTALQRRSRTASGVVGTMSALLTGGAYQGTDSLNRPLLYTPNPREQGSSVSHWDTSLTRNQLMEPFINADLTTFLTAPYDLTLPLLKDLGW